MPHRASVDRTTGFGRTFHCRRRPARARSGPAFSPAPKLGLDYGIQVSICAAREDTQVAPQDIELIGQLLVRAGMIMEDRTGEFIIRVPPHRPAIVARIELLKKTGGQLVALAAAVAAILEESYE
jgi:hypothetical protein